MINVILRACVPAMFATLLLACASSEQKAPPPELIEQADKTISSGVFSYNQSDYPGAEELFTRALYRYRGIDHPEGIAASCINLAKTRLSQGDTAAAKQWIDSAHQVIETSGLNHLQNHVAMVRSSIAIETADFDAAKELLAPLLDETDKTIERMTRLAALQNRTRIAFAENGDAAAWTENYARHVTANEPMHQARLARFRASLADDVAISDSHYNQALGIYRKLAQRPVIAATLSEWAQRDIEHQLYVNADNKLERALFIRAELMDREKCREILALYENIYTDTNDENSLAATRNWIKLLNADDFSQWQELTEAYSGFPGR